MKKTISNTLFWLGSLGLASFDLAMFLNFLYGYDPIYMFLSIYRVFLILIFLGYAILSMIYFDIPDEIVEFGKRSFPYFSLLFFISIIFKYIFCI